MARKLLGWKHSGFSAHNGKPLRREDAAGLERVAQYIIRNPFSEEKMVYNAENGTVIYRSQDAWEHLNRLILDFATDSLLDLHPPRIFQIEGNLRGAAAVTEIFLKSYGGELHFLPALPAEWPDGSVSGLGARGGFTVGMEWQAGKLVAATIKGITAGACVISHAPEHCEIVDPAGVQVPFNRNGHRITFTVNPEAVYPFRVLSQ